ncbi:hypothetical protein BCR33DRAFT_719092 [Rhizoclosmatium globosum]|uniref:Uncharacterized protein n=1 Tax=Rhizoclosmatium globosum TaxID=329046 RepID=A0A1Y2C1T1_9FUNG|nr:hypothetical protein BCR33DRAFT_719092 [Rhizoclosmatium globosum]|eukprot:ORY40988.1 hypothetical protein BCR33DRAFT_719092 [Rhizoclosmatium globosum]
MFRPTKSNNKIPLSRKTIAKAKSNVVGSSIRLALLSPMAVYGIAKSSSTAKREYWSHEELIAEIERRKLTVLPKTFDESNSVLVGQQVSPLLLAYSGTQLAHYVVTKTGSHAVEVASLSAAGVATDAAASKFSSGPEPTYSLQNSTETATKHLSGLWSGFAQSEIEPASSRPSTPLEEDLESKASISDSSNSSGKPGPGGIRGLISSAKAQLSLTTSAIKNSVSGLSKQAVSTASAVISVVTGKGADAVVEEFAVPIKYRMKVQLTIDGVKVSGKNLVDDLDVSGKCHEAGNAIEWQETIPSEGVVVKYTAKVGGGHMNGSWTASDGRKGPFR